MTYRIEVAPAAMRALARVHPRDRPRIQAAIELLAHDPHPPSALRLSGRDGYRVRVGDYEILYTVDQGVLLIVTVTVGHRRDVYRR